MDNTGKISRKPRCDGKSRPVIAGRHDEAIQALSLFRIASGFAFALTGTPATVMAGGVFGGVVGDGFGPCRNCSASGDRRTERPGKPMLRPFRNESVQFYSPKYNAYEKGHL
jgi:hypothetical protein